METPAASGSSPGKGPALTSSPLWPGSPGAPGRPGLPAQPASPSPLSPWSGMDGECEKPHGAQGGGVKRRQRPTHPGLLSPRPLPLCEALRTTARGPVSRVSRELALHQGHPEPSLLPGRSCQGLARRGCPGLPSLHFPGGPPGGPSASGHSPRRCSDEKKGVVAWGPGQRRPGWAAWGKPTPNSASGILLPGTHPLSSSPATCLRQLCCILKGPGPNTGFEFPPGRSSGRAKPTPLSRQACGRRRRGPQRDHLSRLFLKPAPSVRTRHEDLD